MNIIIESKKSPTGPIEEWTPKLVYRNSSIATYLVRTVGKVQWNGLMDRDSMLLLSLYTACRLEIYLWTLKNQSFLRGKTFTTAACACAPTNWIYPFKLENSTFPGTNISPTKGTFESMIFFFTRWDMYGYVSSLEGKGFFFCCPLVYLTNGGPTPRETANLCWKSLSAMTYCGNQICPGFVQTNSFPRVDKLKQFKHWWVRINGLCKLQ